MQEAYKMCLNGFFDILQEMVGHYRLNQRIPPANLWIVRNLRISCYPSSLTQKVIKPLQGEMVSQLFK